MPKLNPNTCYALPEGTVERTGDAITPEALNQLIEAVSQHLDESLRENFQERMQVHVGAGSTYALKQQALQALSVVAARFNDPDILESEKKLIADKLQERAENCTPGFHNGVNAIVDGFYLAESINDLLYRVRQDIVTRMATQLTDEVHTNNRCFVVASTSGYGVHPINDDDIYRSNMSLVLKKR